MATLSRISKHRRVTVLLSGDAIVESSDGWERQWRRNGKLHREDGPAIEWVNGSKQWWRNGKRHREDGPAIEWTNGDKEWYRNGVCDRCDGPVIEWASGHKEWWRNGELQVKKKQK